MKRFLLLLVCATAIVAANAKDLSVKKVAKDVKFVKTASIKNLETNPLGITSTAMFQTSALSKTAVASAKHAVSKGNLEGDYIQVLTDMPTADIAVSLASMVNFTKETLEGEEYVIIEGAIDGACDLIAQYDAEASKLHILSGYYVQEHDTYGKFAFFAYIDNGDDTINPVDYYDLIVTEDADGNLSLVYDDEQEASGWMIYMAEGDYEGYWWTSGEDLVFTQPNATLYAGRETHINDEGTGWTDWAEAENPVYVEQLDGMALIHNMFGSVVSIVFDENDPSSFLLPNGQVIDYGYLGNSNYFEFTTYNCDIDEEGYINPVILGEESDFAADPEFELPGFVGLTKEGCLDYVFAKELEDNKIQWDYIYLAKFISQEGRGYFNGLMGKIEVVMNAPYKDGIASVNAGAKNSKDIFNLAGQKVSKDFKGIVVNNGRKFINK